MDFLYTVIVLEILFSDLIPEKQQRQQKKQPLKLLLPFHSIKEKEKLVSEQCAKVQHPGNHRVGF